jgi:hypothetical protein
VEQHRHGSNPLVGYLIPVSFGATRVL